MARKRWLPAAIGASLLVLVACSPHLPDAPPSAIPAEGAEVDVGSLAQSQARISLDVLIPAEGDVPGALSRARDDARREHLALVDSLPATTRDALATVQLVSLDDEHWEHRLPGYVELNMDRDDVPRVENSVAVVRIDARSPAADGWDLLHEVEMIARDVAVSQHGWIYDSYRAELFDDARFATAVPDARQHDVRGMIRIMGVVSTKGELDHVRTIGLWRLGLPELYLPDVPDAALHDAMGLVRATAQTLVQNGGVTSRGVIVVDLAELPRDWPRPAAGTHRFTWRARWMRGPIHHNAMEIVLSPDGAPKNGPRALTAALRQYRGAR